MKRELFYEELKKIYGTKVFNKVVLDNLKSSSNNIKNSIKKFLLKFLFDEENNLINITKPDDIWFWKEQKNKYCSYRKIFIFFI